MYNRFFNTIYNRISLHFADYKIILGYLPRRVFFIKCKLITAVYNSATATVILCLKIIHGMPENAI